MASVPSYFRWLLDLPRRYWPAWLRRRRPSKGTIRIKVWHQDRLDAARVMARYARAAFEDAWGDRYDIRVDVRRESIPHRLDPDAAFGYVRDHFFAAKDVNAICLPHCDNTGGGSTCKLSVDTGFAQHPDVGDLYRKPNTEGGPTPTPAFASGEPYGLVSSGLHEMGHCVGLGHNVGNMTRHEGQDYADIMPYVDSDNYHLRFSTEAAGKSPEVQ